MAAIRIITCLTLAAALIGCASGDGQTSSEHSQQTRSLIPLAERFAYPIGEGRKLTAAKDRKDDWFNALDFGEQDHLGEDWNKNSGGNTDCGEPVYAAANGVISFSGDTGPGWGNVVIVTTDWLTERKFRPFTGI